MNTELLSRYVAAVREMNNFETGRYELSQPLNLGEIDIIEVDLDNDETVYLKPCSEYYYASYFSASLENFSDEVISALCAQLEEDFEERAEMWEEVEIEVE
jgi:hypothetical protein